MCVLAFLFVFIASFLSSLLPTIRYYDGTVIVIKVFTYFPCFEEMKKIGLCNLHALCVSPPLLNNF
jgi:hypothetical protein